MGGEIAETQPPLETLAKLSKATGLTFDLHVANGAVEIVQVAKAAARGFTFVFDSTVLTALSYARPLVEQLLARHTVGDRPADIIVEAEQDLALLQLTSHRLPGARIYTMAQAHGSHDRIDELLRIPPAGTTVEPVEVGASEETVTARRARGGRIHPAPGREGSHGQAEQRRARRGEVRAGPCLKWICGRTYFLSGPRVLRLSTPEP
ncbi:MULTISPECIES: hypothetical protein [Frankia]|nr:MULTISPECIES: hypothetical protein [Frankia]